MVLGQGKIRIFTSQCIICVRNAAIVDWLRSSGRSISLANQRCFAETGHIDQWLVDLWLCAKKMSKNVMNPGKVSSEAMHKMLIFSKSSDGAPTLDQILNQGLM